MPTAFSLNVNAVGIASGSVQVFDQATNTVISAVAVNSEGTATFSLNQLGLGSHSLIFKYLGDSSFLPSTSILNSNNGSITSPITGAPLQTAVSFIVGTDVAATTLTTSTTTVSFESTSAVLTAIVQASTLPNTGRAPTGTVLFIGAGANGTNVSSALSPSYDSNGNAIATATVLVTPNLFTGGQVTYSAQYQPDATSVYASGAASNQVTISEIILGIPNTNTVTTITPSGGGTSFANTSPLIFNIGVVPGPGYSLLGGTVSGTVTVLANGVAIGSPVTLSAGNTTFTVPVLNNYLELPSGPVTITAQYNGNGIVNCTVIFVCPYPAQASSGVDQISITGNTGGGGSSNPTLSGDFAFVALDTAAPVSPTNTTAAYGLLLTSLNNFAANYGATQAVNLSCSAPAGVSCSFSSGSTVTTLATSLASGLAQPVLYVTTASGSTFASVPKTHDRSWWPAAGGATLAGVLLCGIPGKRRKAQAFFMVLMLALVSSGLGGCGSSGMGSSAAQDAGKASGLGGGGTAPQITVSQGTYRITVNATTTTTTNLLHSVTVNLVVQ